MLRFVAALTVMLSACRAPRDEGAARPTNAAASEPMIVVASAAPAKPETAAGAPPRLTPLAGAWLEPLELPDGNRAYVTPPVGATEPRPLIVGVHGAGDRPEWSCGGWRLAASGHAFVVCPQGLKMDAQRYAWDSESTIARRVGAAIAAARTRFGPYIAAGPAMYAGFSQGATLARTVLLDRERRFRVVLLAEGAYELSGDTGFLRQLRANGTERVALICGNPNCFATAQTRKPRFEREGLELVIAGDPRSGHNLNQLMQEALHRSWPSIVAGLPEWQGFAEFSARASKP